MDSCCDDKADEIAQLRERQGRVLYAVLAINASMFVLEFTAGWLLGSTALLGDSLDMLGDALVYVVSIFVLHRGMRARAGAALFKSGFMMLLSALIIGEAVRKSFLGTVPDGNWMALVGMVALIANLICLGMLYRHRSDDVNMSSTFICSRNDVIANMSVLAAAAFVTMTDTLWPDVIVGVGLALLYLHSSWQVARVAWPQWYSHSTPENQVSPPDDKKKPGDAVSCCQQDAYEERDHICASGEAAHDRQGCRTR